MISWINLLMYRRSIDGRGSRQLFAVRSSSPRFWYIGSSRHLPKGDIIISFARIIRTYHFVEMVLAYANFLLIICQANCTLWISPCFCLFCLFFFCCRLNPFPRRVARWVQEGATMQTNSECNWYWTQQPAYGINNLLIQDFPHFFFTLLV